MCVWIGYTFAGLFVAMSGRIGAIYHVGFPVIARSSFGIWGALWPVFNRAGMFRVPHCQKDAVCMLCRRMRTYKFHSNGMYMVWCTELDRWRMCYPYDPVHLATVSDSPKLYAIR